MTKENNTGTFETRSKIIYNESDLSLRTNAGAANPVLIRIINYYYYYCSGVHPTSYTMGTGSSFQRVKRPGREAEHSPPTSAEVKKMWIYTSTPPYAFMA
jgi:hypothetical protein